MFVKPSDAVAVILLCCLCLNCEAQSTENLEGSWENVLNRRYPVFPAPPGRSNPGAPLLLSPYIKDGRSSEARNHSRVDTEHMIEGISSHAGYITVDENYNSNLWFWYFPVATGDERDTPLVIWLQGGPGASSLFGLFEEMGPFSVDRNGEKLIENPYSWHKNFSLLFIDNPVGTGFSFTDEDGYATNQTQIGKQLYIFMEQFLNIFPELQGAPLFISGESYAGKHIPSLAYQIHKNNPTSKLKINLQGLAIGNGFIDPATMMAYSKFVHQLGLVDDDLAAEMRRYEVGCDAAIAAQDYKTAYRFFSAVLGSFMQKSETNSIYNYVYESQEDSLYGPFTKFIQRPEIRKALHVGPTKFSSIGKVYSALVEDFMTSAKPWLEELLEHYRIMSYSGQMDIICAYPLSVRTFRSLSWSGSDEYLTAARKPWYSGKILAGYVKSSRNFQEVMVRNAGHMVPTDQPSRSLELISAFINKIPLRDTEEESQ